MSEVQDLQRAADDAEEEAERQGREVERLTAERRQALLDGDDAALGRVEAALTTAGRERERALLKGEALLERSFQAMRTAKAEARAAAGREVEELCHQRLDLARRIDALIGELAPLAREWRQLGYQLHAAWLVKGLSDELGAIRPSFQDDDRVCLRACLPPELMIELGGSPGAGTPLTRTDPAAVALAKIEAGAPPRVPQPSEAGTVSIVHSNARAA